MELRRLGPDDAPAFRELRLRALREHPEVFGSSFEAEAELPLAVFAKHLDDTGDDAQFGAFDGGVLVAIVGLHRMVGSKKRHKAMVGNMYVALELRGRGAGRALLDALLEYARALDGLEDVTLAVTVGNPAARALYISAGFVPYGVEPRYIKLEDRFYDIEWMILDLRRR